MLDTFSKAIQKARKMANRTRSAIACTRCKSRKMKCSDYHPCKKCLKARTVCNYSSASNKIEEQVIGGFLSVSSISSRVGKGIFI